MLRIKVLKLTSQADRPVVDTVISAGLTTVTLVCAGAPTECDLSDILCWAAARKYSVRMIF